VNCPKTLILSVTLSIVATTRLLAQDATFNGMLNVLRCRSTSAMECGPIAVNQVENNNVPVETNHCIQVVIPGMAQAVIIQTIAIRSYPSLPLTLRITHISAIRCMWLTLLAARVASRVWCTVNFVRLQ
jgi:hypothetical protein